MKICMGWQYTPESGEQPVLSCFTEPFDTWCLNISLSFLGQ
ncbi:hypothetical protein KT99_04439 [Shewanella benthica KT99]|uniref:Uncharacterized protein n=1 Tax=Shewanella benthica KT99 TaxID=314608 RepID=A9D2J9_9GAMM|nr:hypothetical protein KT99_04439 [Shewanella benthica KT99]